jgi:hypothetical protein
MIPTWRTLLRVKEAARNAALLLAADEEMDSNDDEDGGGRGEERNGFNEDKEWPRRRIHVDAYEQRVIVFGGRRQRIIKQGGR